MQYEKCLKCDNLGDRCKGPNFVQMSSHEIIEWCKARKSLQKMTNETLAELSGIPLGTVNRLFAGKSSDFYFETVRPIIKVLISGDWDAEKCINEGEELSEDIAKVIQKYENEKEFLQKENAYLKEHGDKELALLLPLLKFRKHTIVVLSISLGISLLTIITALVIDRLDPNIGFFWLR